MNYLLAAQARAQAQRMLGVLDVWKPGARQQLSASALAYLGTWAEITVRELAENPSGEGCSVAGSYLAGPPPILAIARSESVARSDFTALHELGHHLQQCHFELMTAFASQPDQGVRLEDAACDAFAAAILLPEELTVRHFGDRGPTAQSISDLWRAGSASRMAACVKASQHLPSPGHVLLLDSTGQVVFAASHGLPPVRRGSDQSGIPVVATALGSPRQRAEGRTRVRYRDGIVGDELYVQIAPIGGYLVAVLVTDTAPWKIFSPSAAEPGPKARWWVCPNCDHNFSSYAVPCSSCGTPKCPECGQCDCPNKVADRMCPGCFLYHPPTMFAVGSDRCRDCA